MENKNDNPFVDYLLRFEKEIMLEGYLSGLFKGSQEKVISLRPGKLDETKLALFLGKEFQSSNVVAFNFYGFHKFSSGLIKVVNENKNIFPNIKAIKSGIVHFQSVKIEHIQQLQKDLLPGFPDFKKFIVNLRGF